LSDDAEELAKRGFHTTAFDISLTAIAWCKKRFTNSTVHYQTNDFFRASRNWIGRFDFVLDSYTLQVLPDELRQGAMKKIAGFVKFGQYGGPGTD